MAHPLGVFSPLLTPEGWFEEGFQPIGWFSSDLVGTFEGVALYDEISEEAFASETVSAAVSTLDSRLETNIPQEEFEAGVTLLVEVTESATAEESFSVEVDTHISAKVAWVQVELPYGVPAVPRKALILLDGALSEIPEGLMGTGLSPVVLHEGSLKVQEDSEGLPVVLIEGCLYALPSFANLLI